MTLNTTSKFEARNSFLITEMNELLQINVSRNVNHENYHIQLAIKLVFVTGKLHKSQFFWWNSTSANLPQFFCRDFTEEMVSAQKFELWYRNWRNWTSVSSDLKIGFQRVQVATYKV